MQPTKDTAIEVGRILDALTVLGADLRCEDHLADDALVLTAHKSRSACAALNEAVTALKNILEIAVEAGGGPVPLAVADRLADSGDGKK
ncbi:MAG: hypothetical protein ABI777_07415 [Betaproteobacteria bacterium]